MQELTGHTSRVLHLAISPTGETVVSAAADETVRFWKIFEREEGRSRTTSRGGSVVAGGGGGGVGVSGREGVRGILGVGAGLGTGMQIR